MAFTAQQQSEAIARIQAFLQLKRETDPTLKDAIPEGPVDGDLGASGSPTRKGIDAWLAKRNLASVIQENDPQYLEKLDAAVRADAATDFVLLQRLRTMAEAAAADRSSRALAMRYSRAPSTASAPLSFVSPPIKATRRWPASSALCRKHRGNARPRSVLLTGSRSIIRPPSLFSLS